MDRSGGAQIGSGACRAEQMAEQLAAHERRLQELMDLQRARLEQLHQQLQALAQAIQQGNRWGQEGLFGGQGATEGMGPGTGSSGMSSCGSEQGGLVDSDAEEFRQRYEMALEDIRRLQAENQELRSQLERIATQRGEAGQREEESWEAFKRRVLEALEAESKEGGPIDQARQEERLQIQEVLAKTEAALSAKDRELETLRHLLEDQAANLGAVAVGAAAVGQLLDQDEIIRQQRETLQRLEAEWREKLRQAEVELSLERAALARKEAELNEKLREVEELRAQLASGQSNSDTQKGTGGWRSFFGLQESRKK